MNVKSVFAGVAAVFLSCFSPAHAATIDVGPGTLDCFLTGTTTMADCQGIVSGPPPVYSMTTASQFSIGNSSEPSEAAFLNGLLGTPMQFAGSDVDKTDKGGVDSASYTVDTPYFLLKLGPTTVYLFNAANSILDVTYTKKQGQAGAGGGLSHESQIGTLSPMAPIPLPAAAPLLLAGLGGLVMIRRRKPATA